MDLTLTAMDFHEKKRLPILERLASAVERSLECGPHCFHRFRHVSLNHCCYPFPASNSTL
ncbi:unnamed protein product [Cylicocyclus nassatus]|uniref:Uncharacterized protein n=1 Tax=Cylicocyclus nassatus TaxID=53992 RepID=A0AA36M689_CYLNA|nr:unnamed protein product [Cylicocyclus nassatus]